MKRRTVGRYWNYDGNSINGKDHERKTPKGYDFDTLLKVVAIANDVECLAHYGYFADYVTKEEAMRMEVVHHKGNAFGHEVTVKAPKSVWDKAKEIQFPY